MPIELSSDRIICYKCGTAYSKRKGYFPASYAQSHRGVGYTPICKNCIQDMYNSYLAQCNDPKAAMRQLCRKLDIYWSEHIYDMVVNKTTTRTLLSTYMLKLCTNTYAGRSYDDTLRDEGTLWDFPDSDSNVITNTNTPNTKTNEDQDDESANIDIPEDVKLFWGSGYTPEMYVALEERKDYWMSRFPEGTELDIGTEAIIRQICSLELDINRDRAAGKSVDKNITALNTLLGSANLKPSQKKDSEIDSALSSTPLGVWLYRYENERPLPQIEDENKIRKTVFTWMGHVCKMLGKKNAYVQLYEDEMDRLRVEKPEFDDEDDETFMMDVLTSSDDEGGGDTSLMKDITQ